MVERSVLNFFIFIASVAFLYLGVTGVDSYVQILTQDRATVVATMQATFMFMYYILIPALKWWLFLWSPERKIIGYYVQVFTRDKRLLSVSISRIKRLFFSGHLTLAGLAYDLKDEDGFAYLGGWSSTSLTVKIDQAIEVSYFYRTSTPTSTFKRRTSAVRASEQNWGITQLFLRHEDRGGGSFWDLEPKPIKVVFSLSRVSLAKLLSTFTTASLSRWQKMKYSFTDALIKDTEKNRELLNIWRKNDWTAPWSDDSVRRAVKQTLEEIDEQTSDRKPSHDEHYLDEGVP